MKPGPNDNHIFMLYISFNRYLEFEYLCNCPNNQDVYSGLGILPLHYVPIGGELALKRLPTGERLSGPETYKTIMRLFTRLEITPPRLREKAVTRLNEMYRKVRGTQGIP